jgi:hypothetical protein
LALNESSLSQFVANLEQLLQPYSDVIELVTRQKLKLFAAEKGLIFDPDSLNEKQRKVLFFY